MTLLARLALGVALVAILLSPARAAQGPKSFSTPEDAATALVEACERHDTAALAAILGPDAGDLDQQRRSRAGQGCASIGSCAAPRKRCAWSPTRSAPVGSSS